MRESFLVPAQERVPTPHERLFEALNRMPDLPKTLTTALKLAQQGQPLRKSIERVETTDEEIVEVLYAHLSDTILRRALTEAVQGNVRWMSGSGEVEVEETEHAWELLLESIAVLKRGTAQGVRGLERDARYFGDEWSILPESVRLYLRPRLLERLRWATRETHDAE